MILIDPDDIYVLSNIGSILSRMGRKEDVVKIGKKIFNVIKREEEEKEGESRRYSRYSRRRTSSVMLAAKFFAENDLNMLGYQLLWREMTEAAIEIHKLNIQAYPESENPYDSLGETYAASGKTELAIESYEKALEINPEMPSAIEALKRLRSTDGESK